MKLCNTIGDAIVHVPAADVPVFLSIAFFPLSPIYACLAPFCVFFIGFSAPVADQANMANFIRQNAGRFFGALCWSLREAYVTLDGYAVTFNDHLWQLNGAAGCDACIHGYSGPSALCHP
jgi:hypothetical protein